MMLARSYHFNYLCMYDCMLHSGMEVEVFCLQSSSVPLSCSAGNEQEGNMRLSVKAKCCFSRSWSLCCSVMHSFVSFFVIYNLFQKRLYPCATRYLE